MLTHPPSYGSPLPPSPSEGSFLSSSSATCNLERVFESSCWSLLTSFTSCSARAAGREGGREGKRELQAASASYSQAELLWLAPQEQTDNMGTRDRQMVSHTILCVHYTRIVKPREGGGV